MTYNGNKVLCQGKDVFERMNYLYQASHAIASKDIHLSSYYNDIIMKCSRKAVLRLETDIKRSICKACQSPLIPGESAKVRLQSKPIKCVKWRCLTCGFTKIYPTKKGYKLWSNSTDAAILEYNYRKKCDSLNNDKIKIKSKDNVETKKVTEDNKIETHDIKNCK